MKLECLLAGVLFLSGGVMPEPVRFTQVASGTQSGIEEAREVVVRSAAEWKTLWQAHAPGEQPPEIDFSSSTVVGVFLGFRSTGGHRVEITSVERTGDGIVVAWRESRPPRDAIVTQVLTFPFHLVRIPRETGKITFQKTTTG
jgi:hypothetical protein